MNNNEFINVLFNSSFSSIAIVSKDGTIVDVNDKFCTTLGLSKRNLLRLKYSDLLFTENNETFIDEYEIENNPIGQRRFKTKYSKFIWLDYSFQCVNSEEMESFFVLFINPLYDEIETLNKLKDLEYRLNEAEIITKLGHWDWNIVDDTLYWSDMMMKIFGKTKKNFTADYNAFIETVHPDDRENVNTCVQETIDKNIPFNMQYRIVVDNVEKIIDAKGKIIFLNGIPTRMFGTCQDITSLKKLQIKEKKQELLLMEQSKLAAMGEMLSAIAHQWRQPLNAVALSTQDFIFLTKHEQKYNEESLDNFKMEIMEQLEYMSSTIDEFRSFFKHESSKESFNLLDLIKSVASLYQAQLKAHEIKLDIEVFDDSSIYKLVALDKEIYKKFAITNRTSELKQVLINCIANAKDAIASLSSNHGYEKEIVLEVKIVNDFVFINICDLAGGIDQNAIDKIFDPTFTTKEYGTGLGLYICKRIIEKSLMGTITYSLKEKQIEDKVVKGSIFEIKIPRILS